MKVLEKRLWGLLKSHLPKDCDHQRIETGSTGRGIPDVNLCWVGKEIWVELKIVKGTKVDIMPEQCAWHYRRTRAGGTTWILARDKADGVRKGKYDRIYLWKGEHAQEVLEHGINAGNKITWERPFDWDDIVKVLFGEDHGCEESGEYFLGREPL